MPSWSLSMSRRTLRLVLIMAALSVFRLWLGSGQLLVALGYAGHDDRLFLTLSQHLFAGRWLGPFDELTLAKGPGYPIWIAASYIAGIPLQFGQNLLYCLACWVTVFAIRPVIPGMAALTIIFSVLLFNPALFSIHRVLREGIYLSLTLLTFACFIGLLVRSNSMPRSLAPWAIGAGVALSGFWLTREEGLWIAPSVGVLLISSAVLIWRGSGSQRMRRLVLLIAPLVILITSIGVVSTINLVRYGVFTVTEYDAPDWLAAYGALSRVDHQAWERYMLVPQSTRAEIYRVSPAFAELQPMLEGRIGSEWGAHPCRLLPDTCGDIGGGWWMWALRQSVGAAGYYRSGGDAMAYYRRLATEVNAACDTGQLRCGPRRDSMLPPWRNEYLAYIWDSFAHAGRYLISLDGASPFAQMSDGDELALLPYRLITRERLAPSSHGIRLRINGWGFAVDSPLQLSVQSADGTAIASTIRPVASSDLYDYFIATENQRYESARRARFSIVTPCWENCFLVVNSNGHMTGKVALSNGSTWFTTPDVRLFIESVQKENDLSEFGMFGMDRVKLQGLAMIADFYRRFSPLLTATVVLSLLVVPIAFCFGYRSVTIIIIVALVGAVLARVVLLAIIDALTFPSINIQYLGPAHALFLLAGVLSVLELRAVTAWIWSTRNAHSTPATTRLDRASQPSD